MALKYRIALLVLVLSIAHIVLMSSSEDYREWVFTLLGPSWGPPIRRGF